MDFVGINGFLGTRASLMLDVVFLAMFVVLPVLGWSISLARRKRYLLHKRVQIGLCLVLLATVLLFEIDMRFLSGWKDRAQPSPYWESGVVWNSLLVHLFFAVTTSVLWTLVAIRALRNFSSPPAPGPHSPWHRRWAWIAAIDMALTSLTGWIFYWLAFAAT